jgi:hypothetical protein
LRRQATAFTAAAYDAAREYARERLGSTDPGGADAALYPGKIASAKFFCRDILTNVYGRHASLTQEHLTAVEVPVQSL